MSHIDRRPSAASSGKSQNELPGAKRYPAKALQASYREFGKSGPTDATDFYRGPQKPKSREHPKEPRHPLPRLLKNCKSGRPISGQKLSLALATLTTSWLTSTRPYLKRPFPKRPSPMHSWPPKRASAHNEKTGSGESKRRQTEPSFCVAGLPWVPIKTRPYPLSLALPFGALPLL